MLFKKPSKTVIFMVIGITCALFGIGMLLAYNKSIGSSLDLTTEIPTQLDQQPKLLFNLYGTGENPLNQPMAVTVDKKGRVYVSNAGSQEVLVFSPRGKLLVTIGGKQSKDVHLKYPYGLAIKSNGNLLVADVVAEEIFEYNAQGKFLRTFLEKNNALGILRPGYLATNKKNQILVTDLQGQKIVILDEQGKLIKELGLSNTGKRGVNFPQGIAVDSKGIVWVADAGNKRLVAYDNNAKQISEIKVSGNVDFETLRGIAVDSLGRIIKADALTNTVSVLDTKGKELFKLENRTSRDNGFTFPTGVFIDNKGKIFIADRGNNRVQIWGYPNLK